jgi:hypothetical protein
MKKVLAEIKALENRLAYGDRHREHDSYDAVKNIVLRWFSTDEEGLKLLNEYGPKACTEAAEETASFYNDMEEIGSSDRWALIQSAKRTLSHYPKKKKHT